MNNERLSKSPQNYLNAGVVLYIIVIHLVVFIIIFPAPLCHNNSAHTQIQVVSGLLRGGTSLLLFHPETPNPPTSSAGSNQAMCLRHTRTSLRFILYRGTRRRAESYSTAQETLLRNDSRNRNRDSFPLPTKRPVCVDINGEFGSCQKFMNSEDDDPRNVFCASKPFTRFGTSTYPGYSNVISFLLP